MSSILERESEHLRGESLIHNVGLAKIKAIVQLNWTSAGNNENQNEQEEAGEIAIRRAQRRVSA